MKAMIFITIFLIFSTTEFLASPKDYSFKVLAAHGDVYSGNIQGKWQKLHFGSELSAGDSIKLAVNSYLGLIHSNGRTKELHGPGKYSGF